ncbi:MAG: hypothetical protein KAX49_09135 [Halanaerobiales bacterium]|nr:hypothetical protein [Halanaerobiales bacterium]
MSEELSKSKRKRLDGLHKNTTDVSCYLIGQLGKNDLYKGVVQGKKIINYAVNVIMKAYQCIGGRFILVECNDVQQLVTFYQSNGFEVLQKDGLVQLVRFL